MTYSLIVPHYGRTSCLSYSHPSVSGMCDRRFALPTRHSSAQGTNRRVENQQFAVKMSSCVNPDSNNLRQSTRMIYPSDQPANNFYQRLVSSIHESTPIEREKKRSSSSSVLSHTSQAAKSKEARRGNYRGEPTFRQGRNGASWRHVTQYINVNGQLTTFIDGVVKELDCMKYPPHGLPMGEWHRDSPPPPPMLGQLKRSSTTL